MSPATRKLHEQLIRHAKGLVTAWEEWLKSQISAAPQSKAELSSSPHHQGKHS